MQAGAVAPAAPAAVAAAPGKNDELVPNLNNYVRGKLSRAEVLTFADCARALATALNAADGSGREVISKIMVRLTLFGGLPPSILPLLVSVRLKVDLPKTADRKLLRVVNYLVQLAAGEGSAGTVVPFSTLSGQVLPPTATDTFEYSALDTLWADVKSESVTHYQRSAAFRTLAALSRSSLSSDPDDLTLVSHLMAAVATTLDRCEAARRRKVPFGIGGNKKTRDADRRQTLERVAAQRAALSASRIGLPGFVQSSKIAPRAFGAVNSPDATCARHALAVAALAARDMPGMYVDQLGQLVANTLEIYHKTGSLGGAEQAAAMAAAAAEGMPAPLRPTKELYQEKSLNLADAWARVYLARGCGAVVHSRVGNSGPFWEMLVLLACCDKSTIVALEAIKGLAGAPFPAAANIGSTAAVATTNGSSSSSRRPVQMPDEHVEAETRLRYAMAWQLLVAHADDDAPDPAGGAAAAAAAAAQSAAANKQFTISRTQRSMQESASLRRLASLGTEAAGRADGSGAASSGLFASIVSRLLLCLSQMSHAAICSATSAVAVLAEARAHALAGARSAADRAAVLGGEGCQELMQLLQERMLAIASDTGFAARQRGKALEALLWSSSLPSGSRGPGPLTSPRQILAWMSTGGGTVSQAVRAIFADPWPEDVLSSFLHALSRRLLSAPAAASYLLACASAVASACPSRVRQEQLHAMWDVCLRANNPSVKLAGLQAALAIMAAPTPAIAAPPSAAAPEVKALASKEEAAMVALARSAAWWLGENANFGTSEYAWAPKPLPQQLVTQLEAADGADQQQLAAAAMALNPVLCLLIARLQRVLVAGLWEVRLAAAQALAKIAVRSGEPFRVQCYSILATAAGGSIAHRARSSSRGGHAAAVGSSNSSQAAAASAAAAAAVAEGASADPLGVAAVAGPALEVLDHIYAGELVVEQLLSRYGPSRSAWPKKLLRSLEQRNAALAAAISERVCFVPPGVFWPLGNAAKELITGVDGERVCFVPPGVFRPLGNAAKELITGVDEAEEERKKKKRQEQQAAAAAAAGTEEQEQQQQATPPRSKAGSPRADEQQQQQQQPGEERSNRLLQQLQGYDYDPAAQPPESEEPYPDDSVSQIDYDDDHYAGAASDDDSDIVTRRGLVLYDFAAEEEDEVAVVKGESLEVAYEVGGWLQVIKRDGSRGLVPKSYVQVAEDEEDDSDALSLAGGGSSAAGAAGGQDDLNSFLARSSMRLRTRRSTADSDTSSSFSGMRQRQQSQRHRRSVEEADSGEPVDAAGMARMVALVAQRGGELDTALEQVEALEAATRGAGGFNQPQALHLQEALAGVIASLDALQLSGDARAMRRQMIDRAAAGQDRLEAARRYAMGGGAAAAAAGGSPMATPRDRERQAGYGGSTVAGAGETAGGYAASEAGAGEEYQYQPTKVRVLYAFDAEAEGELSVAVGDSLWVESEVDGWYAVARDGDGARGLVPSSYVDVEQF
uniref:SH3 domain-containing protein n=1 Tax=Tetradesmus obliquus TaxID=3088 RepID=A0A383W189_TETOB|eukprot:jgi/Sobl393_1/8764/SZX71458.1